MSSNKKEIAEVVELSMSDVTSRLTEIESQLASILSIVQGLQSGKKAVSSGTKKQLLLPIQKRQPLPPKKRLLKNRQERFQQ